MKTVRNQRQIPALIAERKEFSTPERYDAYGRFGASIFGRWQWTENKNAAQYVTYSYGPHWPMYIWQDGQWYGNKDKTSSTTSRHAILCRPASAITWLDRDTMQLILVQGALQTMKNRLCT